MFIKRLLIIFLWLAVSCGANAQTDTADKKLFSGFPLFAGVDFQNFALPFYDIGSYFTHPGISLGTEMRLNRKATWLQQVYGAFVINREMGNSFYLYTQNAFRFGIFRGLGADLKLGLGWQRDFHPSGAYEFNNGTWEKVGGGKSLLIIPVGVSLLYKMPACPNTVPFISYQLLPALFYDDVLPLSFYNLFQVGARINFKTKK